MTATRQPQGHVARGAQGTASPGGGLGPGRLVLQVGARRGQRQAGRHAEALPQRRAGGPFHAWGPRVSRHSPTCIAAPPPRAPRKHGPSTQEGVQSAPAPAPQTPALVFSAQNTNFSFVPSLSLDTEKMDSPYQHLSFGAMWKTWPESVPSSAGKIPEQDEPLSRLRAGRFRCDSPSSRTARGPGRDTERLCWDPRGPPSSLTAVTQDVGHVPPAAQQVSLSSSEWGPPPA